MTRRRIIVPMFADYDGRAADPEHQRRQEQQIYVVYVYVSLHGRHARFAMRRALCLPITTVVPVMQSISGDNDRTQRSYVSLHGRHAPCRPWGLSG